MAGEGDSDNKKDRGATWRYKGLTRSPTPKIGFQISASFFFELI